MSFSLPDHWVWDFWLADDGQRFHLFFLHAPHNLCDPELRHRNARIGHATSADLTSWTFHGLAFAPGSPGSFDGSATWTGSVVRGGAGSGGCSIRARDFHPRRASPTSRPSALRRHPTSSTGPGNPDRSRRPLHLGTFC